VEATVLVTSLLMRNKITESTAYTAKRSVHAAAAKKSSDESLRPAVSISGAKTYFLS
jgi:hypothetical protein